MRTYRRSRTERLRRSRVLRREAYGIPGRPLSDPLDKNIYNLISSFLEGVIFQEEQFGGDIVQAEEVHDMLVKKFKVDPFRVVTNVRWVKNNYDSLLDFIGDLMRNRIIVSDWKDIKSGDFPDDRFGY